MRGPETFDECWEFVTRLAELSEFKYEYLRYAAASHRGWRVTQLDRAGAQVRKEKNARRAIEAAAE